MDDPARPTLSLSYQNRTGGLVTSKKPVHRRVPPFFANMLPEGHLRTYLAERAGVNPEREFFLLAAMGADLPLAVTVTPIDDNREGYHNGDTTDEGGEEPSGDALRFSLAGVQLKFSAVMESSGGLTIPAYGIGIPVPLAHGERNQGRDGRGLAQTRSQGSLAGGHSEGS